METYGDLVPKEAAKTMIDNCHSIKSSSKTAIVETLNEKQLSAASTYYQEDADAYIFDIQLVIDFLADVKQNKQADYPLFIMAADNNSAKMIITGGKAENAKFRVVFGSNDDGGEQLGRASYARLIFPA